MRIAAMFNRSGFSGPLQANALCFTTTLQCAIAVTSYYLLKRFLIVHIGRIYRQQLKYDGSSSKIPLKKMRIVTVQNRTGFSGVANALCLAISSSSRT